MESLACVIDQLQQDPNMAEIVEAELRSLTKKLPEELREAGGPIDIHNPEWVRALVQSAAAEIEGRLKAVEAKS